MSICEVAAILSGEPWCYTPVEIGKLTLPQVQYLLFRRRDKAGNIRRDPDKLETSDPRKDFIAHWRRWGLTKERAAELWRERQRKENKSKNPISGRRLKRK